MPDLQDPPDPRTAQDLVQFLDMLHRLREAYGNPGFHKMERAAGSGRLAKSTLHRIFTGQRDLSRMRDPDQFVEAVVLALDRNLDPLPWVQTVRRLVAEANRVEEVAVTAPPSARGRRRSPFVWLTAAVVGVISIFAGWMIMQAQPPKPAARPDFNQPLTLATGDLVLAIDQQSNADGIPAVVVHPASRPHAWDFVTSHPSNPEYRQLRPSGSTLMCLEIVGASLADDAPAQQWGCLSENNHYWKPQIDPAGLTQFVNLQSGKCLATTAAEPEAGMRLVQRACTDPTARHWRVSAGSPIITTSPTSLSPAQAQGPDPAEYPGGGKDRACNAHPASIEVPATVWPETDKARTPVKNEDANRGQISLGHAATAELIRANRIGASGKEETYYWAEAWTGFTPDRFEFALQWSDRPGRGGWHTCAVLLTRDDRPNVRYATMALPRVATGGAEKTSFRVCLTYRPEHRTTRQTACTSRY